MTDKSAAAAFRSRHFDRGPGPIGRACIALLLAVCGCGSKVADSGVCPSESGPLGNICSACPGEPCAPSDTCSASFHWSSEPRSSYCACVNGHMGCCVLIGVYMPVAQCGYGPFPAPICPVAPPQSGDPCGPGPVACDFNDLCCVGGKVSAVCWRGTWEVFCAQPEPGSDCSSIASGTRCESRSSSSYACRCDEADAGGRAWTCGPGI